MPDSVSAPSQRRADKTNETTATSLTAAGMAAFLLWIFGMIDAGKFFVPPTETAMFMGAGLLPIVHAIGAKWVRRISRDTDGVNCGAPPAPAPEGNADNAKDTLAGGAAAPSP